MLHILIIHLILYFFQMKKSQRSAHLILSRGQRVFSLPRFDRVHLGQGKKWQYINEHLHALYHFLLLTDFLWHILTYFVLLKALGVPFYIFLHPSENHQRTEVFHQKTHKLY